MSWQPHEMNGVETPPNRPGMAVIKRVSATEAEPGDTLTYVDHYRNMGNTPIRAVSIVDSLLPRLEYVKGSARGPEGTAFTTAENRVGSSELKWDLPDVIAPGAFGRSLVPGCGEMIRTLRVLHTPPGRAWGTVLNSSQIMDKVTCLKLGACDGLTAR